MAAIVVGIAFFLRKGRAAQKTKEKTKDFFGTKSGNHITGAISLIVGIFILVYVAIAVFRYDPDAPRAQSYQTIASGMKETGVDNTGQFYKRGFSTRDLTDQSFLAYGGVIVSFGAILYGLVNIVRFRRTNPESQSLRWWLPFDMSRIGALTSKPFSQNDESLPNGFLKIKQYLIPTGAVLVAVLALSLRGCSSSKPSEAAANDSVREMVEGQSNNLIKLQSFIKTNSKTRGEGDNKIYILEFTAILQFQEDCLYGGPGRKPFAAGKGLPQTPTQEMLTFGMNRGRKGETKRWQGEITYEMTERGWRAVRIE